MTGLIGEMLFNVFFPFIMLCNGLNKSECEMHWQTDFLLIKSWAWAKKIIMTIFKLV